MKFVKNITNNIYYFAFIHQDKKTQFVVESNSKTYALDYFFDYFKINCENIDCCEGIYIDKNGNLKSINMKKAFLRRFNP